MYFWCSLVPPRGVLLVCLTRHFETISISRTGGLITSIYKTVYCCFSSDSQSKCVFFFWFRSEKWHKMTKLHSLLMWSQEVTAVPSSWLTQVTEPVLNIVKFTTKQQSKVIKGKTGAWGHSTTLGACWLRTTGYTVAICSCLKSAWKEKHENSVLVRSPWSQFTTEMNLANYPFPEIARVFYGVLYFRLYKDGAIDYLVSLMIRLRGNLWVYSLREPDISWIGNDCYLGITYNHLTTAQ